MYSLSVTSYVADVSIAITANVMPFSWKSSTGNNQHHFLSSRIYRWVPVSQEGPEDHVQCQEWFAWYTFQYHQGSLHLRLFARNLSVDSFWVASFSRTPDRRWLKIIFARFCAFRLTLLISFFFKNSPFRLDINFKATSAMKRNKK